MGVKCLSSLRQRTRSLQFLESRRTRMGLKSLRSVVFLSTAVSLVFLAAAYAVAIPGLRTQPGGAPAGAIDTLAPGEKPSFISNAILVKLTPQARANLRVRGDDVDPAATGIQSL